MSTLEMETKTEVSRRGRRPAEIPTFPRHSLNEALKLAQSIEDNNAGKPYDRINLAEALNMSPNSSAFRDLITSSSRYGLTIGGRIADKIALSDIGRSIVSPMTDEQKNENLKLALLHPELFKMVYEHFDNNKIPRRELLINTLKNEFKVVPEDASLCYDIIIENINDYKLATEIKGTSYLQLKRLSYLESVNDDESEDVDEELAVKPETPTEIPDEVPEKKSMEKPENKQIFIAHGKNKKPLEQLVKILDKYKIARVIATDEPHKGRPVGIKVAEEMKRCSSGIFIFTADVETKDTDGNTILQPNYNVVFELGAGSVLYGDKIIILKEKGVELPSDFNEVGRITFEKDNLSASGLDLISELGALEIIKVIVT
jgi:predicted nucleotide-binding protein